MCWLHHREPIRSSIASSTRTRISVRMGRSGIVGVGVVDEVVEGETVVVGNEEQGWILTVESQVMGQIFMVWVRYG